MYFKIAVAGNGPDPHLSWILSKHPTAKFRRDLAKQDGMRVVRGAFRADGAYVGEVVNDPLSFLQAMRERNAARYLDASLHAVCPENLRGFDVIFRSALHGHNRGHGASASQISDRDFFAPKMLTAELGPFPHGADRAVRLFGEAGIRAEPNTGWGSVRSAFGLSLWTVDPMSTTEFLQKIYLIGHYLTRRASGRRSVPDDQIAKFVHLCAGWLAKLPSRDDLVRELCGFRRGAILAFEEGVKAREDQARRSLDQEDDGLDPDLVPDLDVDGLDEDDDRVDEVDDDAQDAEGAGDAMSAGEADGGSQARRDPLGSPPTRGSLHDLRHEAILGEILRVARSIDPDRAIRIMDLGCASGTLIRKIAERFDRAQILGIDADERMVKRARRNIWRTGLGRDGASFRVQIMHGNFLYPDRDALDAEPDVLVLSEVIEHLEAPDRVALLRTIVRSIRPRVIVLTTPNAQYNVRLGMSAGQRRHPDHRIEYTPAQLQAEVVQILGLTHDVDLVDLVQEDIQPSFVVRATRRADQLRPRADAGQRAPRSRPARIYAPFHLDATNYDVTHGDLLAGTTSPAFLRNARDIFYLGPTISPVDHDPRFPAHLEHPRAAFDYYRSRGVARLVGEHKYMGSRCYLLILRDPEMASLLGVSGPVVANSRSGVPFFDDDAVGSGGARHVLARIHREIAPRMRSDLLILDAEILPWALKARGLIERRFRIPGEVALLDRGRRCSDLTTIRATGEDVGDALHAVDNAHRFLRALDDFAAESALEIRAFHVLAEANLGPRGFARDLRLGMHVPHREQLALLESIAGDLVQSCAWHEIDLSDEASMAASIAAWTNYCEGARGEGFVYKPADGILVTGPDGYPRQPALKVRGRDYLRLIYGIDYLDEAWFARLRRRNTKRKRVQAVQQQEIANRMLLAFLHRNEQARLSYVAAFMGVEGVNMGNIDRTL